MKNSLKPWTLSDLEIKYIQEDFPEWRILKNGAMVYASRAHRLTTHDKIVLLVKGDGKYSGNSIQVFSGDYVRFTERMPNTYEDCLLRDYCTVFTDHKTLTTVINQLKSSELCNLSFWADLEVISRRLFPEFDCDDEAYFGTEYAIEYLVEDI